MSIPFSNTHYRIPRGFANLLEGLTREVLREQPQDIPNFAARYFAELLKKREESGVDPAEWGAALEDRYYNNHSFQQEEGRDADNLLRDQSATIIQAAFRGHQARDGARKLKEEPVINDGFSEKDAETLQVDSTAPQDDNVGARSLPDDGTTGEDVSGAGTIQGEDLETRDGQTQEEEEQKENHPENLITEEQQIQDEKDNLASTEDVKGQDHREEANEDNLASTEDVQGQDHREEANEDNLASTEDVKGQDHREVANEGNLASTEDVKAQDHEEEAKEDNVASTEDMEGQDYKEETMEDNLTTKDVKDQDHREEAKEDNMATTEDYGEGNTIQSQGLDAVGGPSSEEPDSSVTQEDHSQEAKMTEEQQESADNQDNEIKEQPEAKERESSDITTPREQHEGREDPREENEALRKQQAEEALDIALDDPDANAAAAKIQAGFRGHMTRKKMKSGDKDVKHREGKEGTSAQGEHDGD